MESNLQKMIVNLITSFKVDQLEKLLNQGIDPNAVLTSDGNHCIHVAAGLVEQFKSYTILKLLLRFSANPNLQNNQGNTSLHLSASLGHQVTLNILIRNGGDLLRSNKIGFTPIDVGYYSGFISMAEDLTEFLNSEDLTSHNRKKEVTPIEQGTKSSLESRPKSSEKGCLHYFSGNNSSSDNIPISSAASSALAILGTTIDIHSSVDTLDTQGTEDIIATGSAQDTSDDYISASNGFDLPKIQFRPIIDRYDKELEFDLSRASISDFCSALNMAFLQSASSDFFSTISDHTIEDSLTAYQRPSQSGSFSILSSSSGAFVTVMEEFIYEDTEENIQLIEQRTPGIEGTLSGGSAAAARSYDGKLCNAIIESREFNGNSKDLPSDSSSVPSLTESIRRLNENQLREQLKDVGFSPGPITQTTFKVLQRHLLKLRKRPSFQGKQGNCSRFPKELETLLENPLALDYQSIEEMELRMCRVFNVYDEVVSWRDGWNKNCFNYLLLDPRVTKNLPSRYAFTDIKDLFQSFIHSVFYVGKGSRTRPYHHLYEAVSGNWTSGKRQLHQKRQKVEKIKSIWEDGFGVISLHVFQNTIPVEAWTREAAMIAAIGLSNLSNKVQGTFYGPTSTWNKKAKRKLGACLLLKSFYVLLLEGEKQIRPRDISLPKFG